MRTEVRGTPRPTARRARGDDRGVVVHSFLQLFLGALTVGTALFRGNVSYLSFHYETQLGHSNYAASKLAADHTRASNQNTVNNMFSVSIIGPRFAVEADNITMIGDAAIACPQRKNPEMVALCQEFMANHPRLLVKLSFARLQQALVFRVLGNLSLTIDRVVALHAMEQIRSFTVSIAPGVTFQFADPSLSLNIWGGINIGTVCQTAMTDALTSPMVGAAFPVLMHRNLLAGLPRALVLMMPQMLCGMAAGGGGGGGGSSSSAASQAGHTQTQTQPPSSASAGPTNLASGQEPKEPEPTPTASDADGGAPATTTTTTTDSVTVLKTTTVGPSGVGPSDPVGTKKEGKETVKLSMVPTVAKEAEAVCTALRNEMMRSMAESLPLTPDVARYARRTGDSSSPFEFDQKKCEDDALEKASANFLGSIGMPANSASSASKLGGATHMPIDPNWNHSATMQTCASSAKQLDPTIVGLNDAAMTVLSFGTARASIALRTPHAYQSCASWYFPDKEGVHASVPHDLQPLVAGWRWRFSPRGAAP